MQISCRKSIKIEDKPLYICQFQNILDMWRSKLTKINWVTCIIYDTTGMKGLKSYEIIGQSNKHGGIINLVTYVIYDTTGMKGLKELQLNGALNQATS